MGRYFFQRTRKRDVMSEDAGECRTDGCTEVRSTWFLAEHGGYCGGCWWRAGKPGRAEWKRYKETRDE